MSFQYAFSQQILAFHSAVGDDCNRAARPEQTDAMVLRLRNNALALGKPQLAMLGVAHGDGRHEPAAAPESVAAPEPTSEPTLEPTPQLRPQPAAEPRIEPSAPDPDRVLSGDAFSRFVSRPLARDESPHRMWQDLHAADPQPRQRKAALPRSGFRMPSG